MGSSLVDTFSGVDDAGVVALIGVGAVEENAAGARRLAAMGELYARRAPADDTERTCWAIDGHENVVAEIGAELRISRGRARGQLRYAIHLREKLPALMGVFLTGVIDMRMVITNHQPGGVDHRCGADGAAGCGAGAVGAQVDAVVGAQACGAHRLVGGAL